MFIIGGATYEEAAKVAALNASADGTCPRVLLGGTHIHNSKSCVAGCVGAVAGGCVLMSRSSCVLVCTAAASWRKLRRHCRSRSRCLDWCVWALSGGVHKSCYCFSATVLHVWGVLFAPQEYALPRPLSHELSEMHTLVCCGTARGRRRCCPNRCKMRVLHRGALVRQQLRRLGRTQYAAQPATSHSPYTTHISTRNRRRHINTLPRACAAPPARVRPLSPSLRHVRSCRR